MIFRRFFRWLADVPTSVTAFGRRLDELEDEILAQKQRHENLRGGLLTLTRRVTRLQVELEGDDEDEDTDDDPVMEMIAERRKPRAG
jgi:hypothetical protein